jgi:ribose-phosphate pyrophosphokinase
MQTPCGDVAMAQAACAGTGLQEGGQCDQGDSTRPSAVTARVVSATASAALARAVVSELGTAAAPCEVERFPDGELRPFVADVRGDDVYVMQSTGPPVNDNLVELLLVLDACRRAGADRLTAVVPYFGYARQDRRGRAGEPVGARVAADAIAAAGADRLVVVDPHTAGLEAACSIPIEMLTAVPVLAATLRSALAGAAVVVAPDLGAVKLAERYASLLGRQVVVVRKTRLSGRSVRARELVGDVDGRSAVIVDDMISTGATLEAAAEVLAAHGAAPGLVVAAIHGPLTSGATERIAAAGVVRTLVTDTTTASHELAARGPGVLEVCPVAPLLADAIRRLNENAPLDDLLV